ncbi:MFS transporter [Ketogulonicigenium vulgare]|uniref:Arabinose efflux permease family protein n=1 Tax=Ketogulonicigenium vulgare (strain WSH-001) TaxID=759362 RepID=F9Y3K5_KETVW|nr:MFS transporter [Ketogulonicigenium vulgare]ADO43338.1 major facilitator transporter [Ketogulonicigenium vulgare Y25]AEM41625.1 Arabinose efflux permease family protein [Ketogulonicigenium vulgare WSH-001]ALJ81740.1 MFS transporter [Ketogulonicigenium vulgare]ANW34403.1 MFS transporter [Ketogulonicigenium vulgare]AOZ55375.1 major facilitator transporter [Ketogulonicigenium vulgare]
MPVALFALAIGAFGIGLTEFVVAGILPQIAADFGVDIPQAGLMATTYALGVFVGAPILTVLGARVPRKALLIGLALIFTLGNIVTALAPTLPMALAGRILTAFNHGTFFGVGSIIAASLVARDKQASAIAFMFSGLTLANLVGVPAGTWLAQAFDWRLVFWLSAAIGVVTMTSIALWVPRIAGGKAIALRSELRAFIDPQVLLAMGITVFGPAAFFTSITYIAPMMIHEAGFSDAGVTRIMVLFGLGLAVGNWLGGRFADRSLFGTLFVTLAAQALVLLVFWLNVGSGVIASASVFFMAAFGFATVAPIQKLVMDRASAAGAPTMAASVNIGMFNLGNAMGAWVGGATIAAGFGFAAPNWAGAILSLIALGLAFIAWASSATGRMAQQVR